MNRDLITIAKHYGLDAQLIQTAEECSELAQATLKYQRKLKALQDKPCTVDEPIRAARAKINLIEEIGDVQIMINQLIWLMGIEKDVDRVMDTKIERQLERIKEERA